MINFAQSFPLIQAAMTMVPEAWEKDQKMNVEKKAFYNWAAMAMEPWDGPGRKVRNPKVRWMAATILLGDRFVHQKVR